MEHIRNARAEDAVRIAEIEIADYRLNFYPLFLTDRYFFSELTVPTLIEEYRTIPGRIEQTIVYDDGIVKGFLRMEGDRIEKLFVEPVFQNRGIGGKLLDHAAQRGASDLLVLEQNENAIRFYRRHGFALTGERRRVDDTNRFLIRMVRPADRDGYEEV